MQAESNSKTVNKIEFHTVFVSPYLRAMQTCYYLFKNHANKKNIKFIVHPLIFESFSSTGNLVPDAYFATKEKFK